MTAYEKYQPRHFGDIVATTIVDEDSYDFIMRIEKRRPENNISGLRSIAVRGLGKATGKRAEAVARKRNHDHRHPNPLLTANTIAKFLIGEQQLVDFGGDTHPQWGFFVDQIDGYSAGVDPLGTKNIGYWFMIAQNDIPLKTGIGSSPLPKNPAQPWSISFTLMKP